MLQNRQTMAQRERLESGAANVIRGWLMPDEVVVPAPPVCRSPRRHYRKTTAKRSRNVATTVRRDSGQVRLFD